MIEKWRADTTPVLVDEQQRRRLVVVHIGGERRATLGVAEESVRNGESGLKNLFEQFIRQFGHGWRKQVAFGHRRHKRLFGTSARGSDCAPFNWDLLGRKGT